MAITSNASYVPTAAEFNSHWLEVNAELPPASPLVLRTGMTRAAFLALKTDLETVEGTLQQRLNDAQIARGEINARKAALLFWFGRFMTFFEAYFGGSPLAEARPLAPNPSTTTEAFIRPMLDMADLWLRIDEMDGTGEAPPGVTFPVTLTGETAAINLLQPEFVTLLGELRTQQDTEITAEGRAKRSRSRRNFIQKELYEGMKLYRLAMPQALPSGHELQATLPRLTPEDTGTTPDPVAASAVYVSGANSKTVYEASTAADLREYQLRGVIGEEWDDEDAVTIATNDPEDAREFTVAFGLTQPGTKITLKVYVITQTGRERGSAPMTVERPAGS
jgi:hypothetical protein